MECQNLFSGKKKKERKYLNKSSADSFTQSGKR